MTYLLSKGLLKLYVIIMALLGANACSKLLFSNMNFTDKLKFICRIFFFSLVWPLALFSTDGQKVLFKRLEDL